jgi:FkbM family methyltransferase
VWKASSSNPASAEDSVYYHNDIHGSQILVQILRRFLGGRILEVGAGVGHITTQLAAQAQEVVAIEPSRTLFTELQEKTRNLPNVTVFNMTLEQFTHSHGSTPTTTMATFNSIVYVNVLEHIADDEQELSRAKALLVHSGRLLIVVPAHQWLYSKVDRLTGHFRRYSRRGLLQLIASSGLRCEHLRYFDSIGLIPYLVLYRWFRSVATTGANASIYSRLILPLSLGTYRATAGRLIGKNLVAVAQKTAN